MSLQIIQQKDVNLTNIKFTLVFALVKMKISF
jgi:hypothetical protein